MSLCHIYPSHSLLCLSVLAVAEKVTVSGGPVVQRLRLSEETDSAGSSSSNLLDEDLIQYYKFLADKGDTSAQVARQQFPHTPFRQSPANSEILPIRRWDWLNFTYRAAEACP